MSANVLVGLGWGSRAARLLLLALIALAALALTPTPSSAYVYVAGSYGVYRAAFDGRLVGNGRLVGSGFIHVNDYAQDVAVDAAHVYWSDPTANAIGRADLDGTHTEPHFITEAGNPRGLAVNAAHVYWVTDSGIARANLDGTGIAKDFIADDARNVAVDAQHIYWVSGGSSEVSRANLDGTAIIEKFVDFRDALSPEAIAVDANYVYAVFPPEGWVERANLDDRSPALLTPGGNGPFDVAVDAEHVYWANNWGGTIGRANLDGSQIDQGFIDPPPWVSPIGIAVDGWDTPNTRIRKANIAPRRRKAVFTFSSSQPESTFACTLDRRNTMLCKSPKTYRRLKSGLHTFKVRASTPAESDPSPAKKRFRM